MEHWDKYTYPKPNLKETMATFLRYRNVVAHGGNISPEDKVIKEVFTRYKNLVSELMYEIHSKFLRTIENKTYLKT